MNHIGKVRTKAKLSNAVTELEQINYRAALSAAEEGIVLLENNGVLPLASGCRVALYGTGVTHTVKGGSGEVNERHSISIYEGSSAVSMLWYKGHDQGSGRLWAEAG